jgi:hypothetical protein
VLKENEPMPRTKPSGLHQLLKTIRLLLISIAAAAGLALGSPWRVLIIRLLLLWAALYLAFNLFEIIVQFLSAKATAKVLRPAGSPKEKTESAHHDAMMK